MQMTNYFICCEACFERIGKRNTNAARLWMDLCALRMKHGDRVVVTSPELPELRQLETLGFIVTTEFKEKLGIYIKGHILSEDGQDFFCIEGGNHG